MKNKCHNRIENIVRKGKIACHNPFTLDWNKFKSFTDDKLHVTEIMMSVFG